MNPNRKVKVELRWSSWNERYRVIKLYNTNTPRVGTMMSEAELIQLIGNNKFDDVIVHAEQLH